MYKESTMICLLKIHMYTVNTIQTLGFLKKMILNCMMYISPKKQKRHKTVLVT